MYGTRNYDKYTDAGIPGPKPWPFIGTMHVFYSHSLYNYAAEMRKRYGNVIRTFDGNTPNILIFDEEMISQVMVKKFPDFVNRRSFITGDKVADSMLTALKDDRWKLVRSTMSPSFTTGKLKGMTKEINRCAKQFADSCTAKGGPVEVRNLAGSFTMDVIASTAFGLRVNSQADQDNAFVVHGKEMTNVGFRSLTVVVMMLLPKLLPLLSKAGVPIVEDKARKFFVEVFEQTLQGRQKSDKTRNDFIQLMLNAQKGDQIYEDKDAAEVEKLDVKTLKGISHDEILGNALIFLFAGYDTTSLGLTQLLYCLALNPECQEKVYEEIETHVGNKGELDYDTMHKLQYLEQCLQESLRLYPAISLIERETKSDTEICGIKIKKGTLVSIPVHAIHHDPEVWPEPEKFDPDRFTPAAKQGRSATNWIPFGLGPRNCIGMRLALLEIKMAVTQVLRSHKLVPCEKTEVPLTFSQSKYMYAVNGVWLGVEKR